MDLKNKHDSIVSHVLGKTKFISDLPKMEGEVWVDFLPSSIAHGVLEDIDRKAALELPGVINILLAKDILGENCVAPISKDWPLIVDKDIQYFGQPLALIIAEDALSASMARKAIITKEKEFEPILSIQEAMEKNSYLSNPIVFKTGNCKEGWEESDFIWESSFSCNGQEHFYLETQSTLAIPQDNGCIDLFSSTQHPTETQHVVAEVLGIPFNKVTCNVTRLGGAFGGKESQATSFAALAALAAYIEERPARLVLDRDTDMISTGKRHPFFFSFKVGYDNEGRIKALDIKAFSDGGAFVDLSIPVLERALFHITNAYYIPNLVAIGQVCKTNKPPNTAFRGFGAPQGMAAMESIIEAIAFKLGKDPLEVKKNNVLSSPHKDTMPYGQKIKDPHFIDIIDQLKESFSYSIRKKEIEEYNKGGHSFLKGISLVPVCFGISFTATFLNQANAIVNIHLDGTIQVSTGAIEMGQGVNIKIARTVADALGVSEQDVRVMPTSTEKNHNTSPTAASTGSDLNGHAAMLAALKIKNRLAQLARAHFAGIDTVNLDVLSSYSEENIEFKEGLVSDLKNADLNISFKELINKAYFSRISLGDHAFYKTPGLNFDKKINKGRPFNYYTQGAAISEVSIHRYTGKVKVKQVDILMDLGHSFNTEIDRGQVTGAFIQGLGWVSNEEMVFNNKGMFITKGPSTYKVPMSTDFPDIFNLDFLSHKVSSAGLKRSKAVGEPPLCLSLSVWNAIRNAVLSQNENALGMKLPATGEEILKYL